MFSGNEIAGAAARELAILLCAVLAAGMVIGGLVMLAIHMIFAG